MNFSAHHRGRKWPFGGLKAGATAMVTVVAVLTLFCADLRAAAAFRRSGRWTWGTWGEPFRGRMRPRRAARASKVPLPRPRPADLASKVPLPRPRPAGAPKAEPEQPAAAPAPAGKTPAAEALPAPVPAPPSACRLALTADIAVAPSIPDIHGSNGCGGTDLVRLEAIMLPDKHKVAVVPPATLRCTMATAIADWVRTDIAPLAASLDSEIAKLVSLGSYSCRTFNSIAGAHLSEHGRANALDVRGFDLADGRSFLLTDRNQPRDLREKVKHSACARFTTVLGPDSDWYHEEHVHLDLMQRHNNYRICQWDVLDPLPAIAPLLPAPRPADAPPSQVNGKDHKRIDGK